MFKFRETVWSIKCFLLMHIFFTALDKHSDVADIYRVLFFSVMHRSFYCTK